MKRTTRACLTGLALVAATTIAGAWGSTGHRFINRRAAVHLPSVMQTFKADSFYYQSHASDADIRRDYSDTSLYAEWPRHYIDIDYYPNFRTMTHELGAVIANYGWNRVKDNGVNPWATKWVLDSLTAQLRRGDLARARQTASDLGHYVGDAHQPLHCTLNYNPGGLHSRYESSLITLEQNALTTHPQDIEYIASPVDFAFSYIIHSNSLVNPLIAADGAAQTASGWDGTGTPPNQYYIELWDRARDFTLDQFQRATVDLASLWYTAWVDAGLPSAVTEFSASPPGEFVLRRNYPNPFNPSTTVSFSLPSASVVSLGVWSADGREVLSLDAGVRPAGEHSIRVDLGEFASGMYLCRLRAGRWTSVRTMLLVK